MPEILLGIKLTVLVYIIYANLRDYLHHTAIIFHYFTLINCSYKGL